jgi:acyl-CoA synthetase (AMP-forming)/AMP-acid ligase II
MLQQLRASGNPGLVLFSSGTTGRPKAILHDFSQFLVRFRTPRPALVTMSFLLFDHIGGINTLLHTLFNNGQVVVPSKRSPAEVVSEIIANAVELLPTTPTFLRLLMLSGELGRLAFSKLQVITYGTERMDEPTLARLAVALPNVDLRQTYGMSELGILRIKSRARDSLYMKVGGEGVTTRVNDESVLEIKSESRMIGYLNAPSPFNDEGWYDTKDIVSVDGEYLRITGRKGDLINIGGQKILPAEVERVALEMPGVAFAKAVGAPNPITGQHIEVLVQASEGIELDKKQIALHFRENLPAAFQPHRIRIDNVKIGHRFKQL